MGKVTLFNETAERQWKSFEQNWSMKEPPCLSLGFFSSCGLLSCLLSFLCSHSFIYFLSRILLLLSLTLISRELHQPHSCSVKLFRKEVRTLNVSSLIWLCVSLSVWWRSGFKGFTVKMRFWFRFCFSGCHGLYAGGDLIRALVESERLECSCVCLYE